MLQVIKLLKWRSSELTNNLQKQESTKQLARLARKVSQVASTTSTYNRFFFCKAQPTAYRTYVCETITKKDFHSPHSRSFTRRFHRLATSIWRTNV
jgi:hypothetical protein